MSDQNVHKEERKLTAYERWELPHLDNPTPKRDTGPAILVHKDVVEVVEEVDQDSLVYEPLTASQLEEIRVAAYEEGLIQGEEEGHKKGYDDGFLKGQEAGHEKGHNEGHQLGVQEGLELAKQTAQEQLSVIEALLSDVAKEITQPLEESRSAAQEILYQSVVRMVENICLSKMKEEGRAILKDQLSRVFNEIGEYEGHVRLTINPDDHAILESLGIKGRLKLQINTDESLMSGGFVLDSKSFHVDGRVEQRLEAVISELNTLVVAESS